MSEKKSPAQIRAEEHAAMWPGAPKRAEPANEHAANLRRASERLQTGEVRFYNEADTCEEAAAEIERLAARVRELQEALTMKAFCEPEVTVIPRSDRPWLPIESAPRDGTRVELWDGLVAFYGHFSIGSWWAENNREKQPIHWRPEPAGPESPPLPSG